MRSLTLACAAIAAVTVLPSLPARAQDAGDLPDVTDRYEGTGAHVGSFWLLPTVESGLFFDSNPKASSSGKGDSWGAYIAPRVNLESDWGRHSLDISLGAKHYEYFDGSDANRTTVDGSAEASIDIRRDLVFVTGVKGGVFEDAIGDLNNSGLADEPTTHREFGTYASLNKAFNRLSVSVGGAYKAMDYQDVPSILGGKIDQDFRDGHTFETGGRVSYEISPGYSFYTDVRYNWRQYESNVGESDGVRGLAGLEFELGRMLQGEAGVGYMAQFYNSAPDEGTLTYHAGLIWNPTPLMTVKLSGDRGISDSAVAGTSSFITDKADLRVDYEVLRGVVLSPWVAVTHTDYTNISQTGFAYDLGLQLDYSVNRLMSVGMNYVYTNSKTDSAAPGIDDFDRHVVGAYVKARF